MLRSLIAFHINGVSNFTYLITSNIWFALLFAGLIGTIFLNLKSQVDSSIGEEQRII